MKGMGKRRWRTRFTVAQKKWLHAFVALDLAMGLGVAARQNRVRPREKSSDEFVSLDLTRRHDFIALDLARRHASLYKITGDGLLVWRAYQEFRQYDLPIPEPILIKFDDFAARLSNASGARGIAEALEMAVKRGGRVGGGRTRAAERQRDILEEVDGRIHGLRERKSKAWSETAKVFQTTPGRVKTLYYQRLKKKR